MGWRAAENGVQGAESMTEEAEDGDGEREARKGRREKNWTAVDRPYASEYLKSKTQRRGTKAGKRNGGAEKGGGKAGD